jgi:hypothetical protein
MTPDREPDRASALFGIILAAMSSSVVTALAVCLLR